MKVLITGASGNLGSHLTAVCERQGFSYKCLTRDNADDLDKLIRGCNTVIHAAGDVTHSVAHKLVEVTESNLLLTARVLEACDKNNVSRFFYVSSCAVYGNASTSREVGEYYPISLNGKFKKLNEELIAAYCINRDISATSFRLFNLYGGRDRFSILSHLQRCYLSKERFKLLNEGLSRRDFIHVADAAEIICRCLMLDDLPDVLNVGTGKTTAVREIVDVFCNVNPSLEIDNLTLEEVEYSRADTSRLEQIVGDYQFRNVLDDVAKFSFD